MDAVQIDQMQIDRGVTSCSGQWGEKWWNGEERRRKQMGVGKTHRYCGMIH